MSLPNPPSSEDLEQFQEWFEQFDGDFGRPDPTVEWLLESHPDLVECLKGFDLNSAVRWIASLETIPELLENTVRINVLQHLAVECCDGEREATPADLRTWVELLRKSPMAMQEDPPEDVFVGYVCSRNGGFRVFPGIISNADFILERLLEFLSEKVSFPNFQEACDSVISLLTLSEAIAEKLQLPRYSVGASLEEDSFSLPPVDRLEAHAKAVCFDGSDLEALGVDHGNLAPFIFESSKRNNFSLENLLGSSLEKRPLLANSNGGIVVASPALLCRAATVHILNVVPIMGGWAETFFEKESAEFFWNRILRRIGVTPGGPITLPKPPSILPPLYPFAGLFDHGILVLGLTRTSSIIGGSDLEEFESFSNDQIAAFENYLSGCCAALEDVEGFKGGMILLAMSSIGKAIMLAFNELRPRWRFFSAGLGDWLTLAGDNDFSAKRLWYLAVQQEMAEKANLEVMNTSGLLNLYGFWKQNDFGLIPRAMDPRNPNNLMVLGGQTSQPINVGLKVLNDRHSLLYPDRMTWVEVQRQGAGLNPDISTNRMYCDFQSASNGIIRGVVEHGGGVWWIEVTKRPEKLEAIDLVFRLWDCVFSWAERVILLLADKHPNWIPNDLVISLEFPKVDQWSLKTVSGNSGEERALGVETIAESAFARLVFEEEFLSKFYRPDNLAEREIVKAIIHAATVVSHLRITDPNIEECSREVTKDDNSRFFHILRAATLESAIGEPGNAKPNLIPEEETARIGMALAYTVEESPPVKITNAKEAQIFLDRVVKGIHGRLSENLKKFWILPVVSHSFSQLDELSRDGSRWSISTRSLLSLEDGAEWVRERLRTEGGRLTSAVVANRALIETAVYSFDSSAKEIISQTEHASFLAEIAVMIELANYRDAVANGFVEADITIHPNGSIEYDDSFQREVVQPYLRSRVDDKIQSDAESYENNFDVSDPEEQISAERSPEVVAFESAFLAEFGFSPEILSKVVDVFTEFAFRSGDAGGTIESLVFRQVLKNGVGLTEKQVEVFLDRFVLPIRSAWDKKLPKGCDANDVLPWRYFRGLSVLVRPFIEVCRAPRQFAVSAPHLHRWGRYLVESISKGTLPEKLFQSTQMRSYLGSVANRKGHEFAVRVAEAMKKILPNVRLEINLTELGAPPDPDLGDIDVLAWDSTSGAVFLIECKRLKPALTVRQVIQQLEEFRGDASNPEDSLFKHQRRVEWLRSNPTEIERISGIPVNEIRWVSLLVTSGRVPMAFIDATNFSRSQVIRFQELDSRIPELVSETAPADTLLTIENINGEGNATQDSPTSSLGLPGSADPVC